MAKRFTDTDKWKKPLLRTMQAPYKLLLLYILDDCDHAGIWQVDLDVAALRIGEKLDHKEAITALGKLIVEVDNGEKWFIPSFIEFQYGVLNFENRVHESVINILSKYGLHEKKPLVSPLHGAIDKDKDKDLDKDKEKDSRARPKDKEAVKAYMIEQGVAFIHSNDQAEKFMDFYISKGWVVGKSPMKDWKAAVRNWIKTANTNNSLFTNNVPQGRVYDPSGGIYPPATT
jgi:hypothetical protein